MHAADDSSVMETLEALPYVIHSAKAFTKGKPYRIGPSQHSGARQSVRRRVGANPDNGRVCLADMDPRQRGLFGAAWTLGYVAAFAGSAASRRSRSGAVTGPQGMIYRKADYRAAGFRRAARRAVYPLYHVIAGLAAASGAKRIAATSAAPSTIAALAYRAKAGPVLWLANLTGEPKKAKVDGLQRRGDACRRSIFRAMARPLADPKLPVERRQGGEEGRHGRTWALCGRPHSGGVMSTRMSVAAGLHRR